MINIHLYPSDFSCETRIEKQAKSINKIGFFTKIFLIGLAPQMNNLNQWSIDDTVSVRLVGQRFSNFSIFGKILSIASYYIETYRLVKDNDVGCINAHSLSVLPFCVFLARKVGAKLIYDTHELETETNSMGTPVTVNNPTTNSANSSGLTIADASSGFTPLSGN